jgi:hypothetical protein
MRVRGRRTRPGTPARSRILRVAGPALVSIGLLAGCGTVPSSPSQLGTPSVHKTTPAASATPSPAHPAAAGCGAQPALQALDASPGTSALTGVQFVSPSQGWVVGTRQILATTNGGRNWSVQDTGDLNLVSADFIGNAVGWAVGADTLLTTSDGGQRWTALPEPCPVIRSVHFVSAKVGFAVAGGSTLAGLSLSPMSGGELLGSTDGGHSWQRLSAPADPQSVCFTDPQDGWLGAGGGLYRTTDGGQTWTPTGAPPGRSDAGYPFTMTVQCAGPSSAWGLDAGYGAASSQQPHIGYHAGPAGTTPIFAEQYFPHPGIAVTADAPGGDTGTLSAISPTSAVYIDFCSACGYGTAPLDLATASGSALQHRGNVAGITLADGASFVTPSTGWVVGALTKYSSGGQARSLAKIMHTDDGGLTWQVQYSQS